MGLERNWTVEERKGLAAALESTYRPSAEGKALAARKLSAALGRHFSADSVDWVSEDGRVVLLEDGDCFRLGKGNEASHGYKVFRNGRELDFE